MRLNTHVAALGVIFSALPAYTQDINLICQSIPRPVFSQAEPALREFLDEFSVSDAESTVSLLSADGVDTTVEQLLFKRERMLAELDRIALDPTLENYATFYNDAIYLALPLSKEEPGSFEVVGMHMLYFSECDQGLSSIDEMIVAAEQSRAERLSFKPEPDTPAFVVKQWMTALQDGACSEVRALSCQGPGYPIATQACSAAEIDEAATRLDDTSPMPGLIDEADQPAQNEGLPGVDSSDSRMIQMGVAVAMELSAKRWDASRLRYYHVEHRSSALRAVVRLDGEIGVGQRYSRDEDIEFSPVEAVLSDQSRLISVAKVHGQWKVCAPTQFQRTEPQ